MFSSNLLYDRKNCITFLPDTTYNPQAWHSGCYTIDKTIIGFKLSIDLL